MYLLLLIDAKVIKRMKKFTFIITIFLLLMSPLISSNGVNYFIKNYSRNKRIVVLDAGHGGHDSGALGKKYKEKDLSLQMILKLGQLIEEQYADIEVVYTRTSDKFLPLYERIGIANKKKADLFLSIHCNYISNAKTKGTETFVMGLHRAAENLAVAQRENEVILMENDYTSNYEGFDPNSPVGHIVLSSFQDAYLEKSLGFASKVEKNFDALGGTHSRGVKQAGFAVLRRATMPSVLIETGFLSNEEEEERIGSDDGQYAVAKSICDALASFFDVHQEKKLASKTYNKVTNDEDDSIANQESSRKKQNKKISYRIQFAAMKQEADKKSMAMLEKVGSIHKVQENGYFKYQIGDFESQDKAEEVRKEIAKLGYNSSFIVSRIKE